MKAAIICFTKNGRKLAGQTKEVFRQLGWEVSSYIKSKYASGDSVKRVSVDAEIYSGSLSEWTRDQFSSCQVLVFVGATGIAVRAIAPYVRDKRKDPAVLVMDEKGKFVIPLLSGHIGGANELAGCLSERLGAVPVFTTATDVNRLFAVDVFAKKNNLWISDMKLAKEISACLLHGKTVYVTADETQEERLSQLLWPEGLVFQQGMQAREWMETSERTQLAGVRIHIGLKRQQWLPKNTLYLVPKAAVVGIGCKKHTPCETIRDHVCTVLEEQGVFVQAVGRAATIDIKAHEEGLLSLAEMYDWEFQTFSAKELKRVPGNYSASAFVSSVTGVDNVCERSARLASDMGPLIIEKNGKNGVTVACAVKDWSVRFE